MINIIVILSVYLEYTAIFVRLELAHTFHVNPTALSQAGRHMEDSIVATLLLGILVKHNLVRVSQFTPYH